MINKKLCENLKRKIKNLVDKSVSLRNMAQSQSGETKHKTQMNKRDVVGYKTRHYLLAYGFLRGKTIEQIESEMTRTIPDISYVKDIIEVAFEDSIVDVFDNIDESTKNRLENISNRIKTTSQKENTQSLSA